VDMLWPPGDLAISISAHNSQTEPEARVFGGPELRKAASESIVSRNRRGRKTEGVSFGPAPGRPALLCCLRSPLPLCVTPIVLPQSAISTAVQHIGLFTNGKRGAPAPHRARTPQFPAACPFLERLGGRAPRRSGSPGKPSLWVTRQQAPRSTARHSMLPRDTKQCGFPPHSPPGRSARGLQSC
jgi:hypothetical protein